jgi:hypothetical protein
MNHIVGHQGIERFPIGAHQRFSTCLFAPLDFGRNVACHVIYSSPFMYLTHWSWLATSASINALQRRLSTDWTMGFESAMV